MNERIGKGRTAVSYLRVSGKGQIEGDGIPRQRAVIETYATANDIEVLAEFRDEGVSGTKELEARDGLAELVVRIKERQCRPGAGGERQPVGQRSARGRVAATSAYGPQGPGDCC